VRKPYPKYKEAQASPLGEIPAHWDEKRFGYLFSFGKGLNITKENLLDEGVPCINYGEVHSKYGFEVNPEKDQLRCVSEDYLETSKNCLLEHGDFIYADTSEDLEGSGNFTYFNSKTTAFAGYHTILNKQKKREHDSRYLAYLFDSKPFRSQIQREVSGTKVFSITKSILKDTVVLLPTKEEQKSIVIYLDKKTSSIDDLITKKYDFAERLIEKRAALISQVVTKGLPLDEAKKNGLPVNQKTKSSGIEHLGDISDHWNIRPLRYLGECQNGISKEGAAFGTGLPFVSYGDAYRDFSLPSHVSGLIESTEEERRIFSVQRGDIFFTRTSETIEEIGLASTCTSTIEDATFAGFLIRFRPSPNVLDVGFSKYYFRAAIHRRFFVKEVNIVTRASLSQDLLKKLPVLIPPLNEQKAIAAYLDDKTLRIDQLIRKTELTIEKLKEFRSSLITSAVTGKIDVREATK
jgi:type I restriction enzyme, S subunit